MNATAKLNQLIETRNLEVAKLQKQASTLKGATEIINAFKAQFNETGFVQLNDAISELARVNALRTLEAVA
jgi:hypothetical protein